MCEPLFQRAQRNRGCFLRLHVYAKHAASVGAIEREQPCYLETF